jgi:antitoxin (DNA-binding transcriptional repressor) of toxin-antitoxin stability system
MSNTLTVTEASRNFSDVISRTFYRHETTVLLKGGKPVARIVPVVSATITGGELAALWADLPHLDASDADAFALELESASRSLPAPRDPWA